MQNSQDIKPHLVFDLETKSSFQEAKNNIYKLGVSLAVTYDLISCEYKTYLEEDVPQLVEDLFCAREVIGFNIKHFDFKVLTAYSRENFTRIKCLDLLERVHRSLGFRVSLDKLAQNTLNECKSGDGLAAIRWYREGNWRLLEEYCRKDVSVTAKLYEFGREHKFLYYPHKGEKRKVTVDW